MSNSGTTFICVNKSKRNQLSADADPRILQRDPTNQESFSCAQLILQHPLKKALENCSLGHDMTLFQV